MHTSFLKAQYAIQVAGEDKPTDALTHTSAIQTIIDPRFDSLITRATRSNQISPTSNTDINSPNTNSTTQLDSTLQKDSKRQFLSPACKNRLQGLLIGLLITAISIAIILSVLLTRSSSATTTSTLSTCDTLQWNPVGITVLGNGSSGSSLSQLNGPIGVFVDANDVVYIADTNNDRVLRVSTLANGTNIGILVAGITGVSTFGSNTLKSPAAVYVDSQQNLYIADTFNYRVQYWPYGASNGSTVAGSSIGVSGSTLDKLGNNYALYVDKANNVYVSDGSNGRVVKWSSGASTGVLVAGNGSSGYTFGQLSLPLGIAVDSQSNTIYIADVNMQTIVAWPSGNTAGTIVAGLNSTIGDTPSLLYYPWGIIRDIYGNLYVSDYGNNRVQKFCVNGSSFSSGVIIAGIGLPQLSSKGLHAPTGLAFDSQMNLYVADYDNHRIQKFVRTN